MKNYNCVIILGPTGSGKTNLSLKLANCVNGEIINADSMQVYKYLNIGTAKATQEEQQIAKHHLIDIIDPKDTFSVSEYKDLALNKCKELINKNTIPIIVGGTGFYIQSLITNLSYGDVKDDNYREELNRLIDINGREYIYNLLKEIDPKTAEKLHVNDVKRIVRALEIFKVTGKTKSQIECEDSAKSAFSFLKPYIIGLTCDREILYDRINKRVDLMIEGGLLDELKWCINYGLNLDHQSMGGIGYKELFPYFNNEISLTEAINNIKQHTRNYAKRQLTWFRNMDSINWYDISKNSINEILEDVLVKLK